MKKQVHFSRKKRQLARLAAELQEAMKHRSVTYVEQLKLKIKLLLQDLAGSVSKFQLRGILGAVAVFFGLGMATEVKAQSNNFVAPVDSPYGLVGDTTVNEFWEFVDLDDDGDLDIISVSTPLYSQGYSDNGPFLYYQNTGTASNPSYAAPQVNPFGLTDVYVVGIPTVGDLDNDGDLDIVVGEYYGDFLYFENTGTKSSPAFAAPQTNPFGLLTPAYINSPELADLDGDGDLDLMMIRYDTAGNNLVYKENIGTASNPMFANPTSDPFGIVFTKESFVLDFEDMDGDGDLDLVMGGYTDHGLDYYENTGSKNAPAFGPVQTNPFGFNVGTFEGSIFPTVGDLDNDGDMDIMMANDYGQILYFENAASIGVAEKELVSTIYPNPIINTIAIDSEAQIERLEILDLSGRLVHVEQYPNQRVNLDFLESGVYLIKLSGENSATKVHKITKN